MYTSFYGLREKPFQLSPDPRFLFLAESHREALAHLLFGIEQGEGFIAITGEVGTGKTTLCRTLLQRLDPGAEVALLFNPQLPAAELLEAILVELGLETAGRSLRELMAELNRFLLERKQAGRRVLLIIDEAQALAPDALEQIRMLSNLETDTSKLIQIVLLGQPEFDAMLESPSLRQLRQRVSVRWRLTPLTEIETGEYVRHRLRIAAGGRCDLFTSAALREVHRRSGGIPRVINLLCDRALIAGYGSEVRSIDLPLVAQADRELSGGSAPGRTWLDAADRHRWLRRLAPAAGVLAVALLLGIGSQWIGPGETPHPQGPTAAVSAAPTPALEAAVARVQPAGEAAVPVSADPTPTPTGEAPEVSSLEPGARASEPAAAPISGAELDRFLAATEPGSSIAAALDAALGSWGLTSSGARSLTVAASLSELEARGLAVQQLHGTDSRELARLGHLALVPLRTPDAPARPVLVEALDETHVSIVGLLEGSASLSLLRSDFDSHMRGDAWIIWRDFEGLPPVLRWGFEGPAVEWLQKSLLRLGYLGMSPSGVFEDLTWEAVRAFQAQHGLDVDGVVGPRTKMALYAELRTYRLPRLVRQTRSVG